MVFLFAGTFQFGYSLYQYNLLKNAVNDAAAYAALKAYDSSSCTPSDAFKDAVKKMAVYGNPAGGTESIARNLATTNVDLTVGWSNTCGVAGGLPISMTVSVNSFTIQAIFANFTLTGKPAVTYPYTGVYSPF
jgi:hypothetical protein